MEKEDSGTTGEFSSLDGIGLGLDCKLPIGFLQSVATKAESNGFAALWAIHYHYYRDPFVVLAAVAAKTRTVLLGTAVTNTFEKHPISVAMSAATVHEQSGRPTILGLGRGVEHILSGQMGIEYGDSFQELEESITVIREFFSGRTVNFRGKIFNVNDVSMGIQMRGDRIPVFLAGMGRKALDLAARVADGVVLNYCTTPSYISHAVAEMKKTRAENKGDLRTTSLLWVMPQETDESMQYARRTLADLLSFPGFGDTLLPFMNEDLALLRELRKLYFLPEGRKDLDSAARLISDRLVKSVVIVGEKGAKARIDEYRRAGLEHPILVPLGGDSQLGRTIEVYAKS